MKKIILYYLYTRIDNTEREKKDHVRFCKEHKLFGRVIIAHEGINGTLSGEIADVEAYMEYLRNHALFHDVEFKEAYVAVNPFPRVSVKCRKEIVSLSLPEDIDITQAGNKKGVYIEPEVFHDMMQSKEEYYIIDMRNGYETEIGKFKNSIILNMQTFKDLPSVIHNIENLREKKVITVCTGGVRCEKATAYLLKSGFKNVSQLHGGIIKYCNSFPDGTFEGKCYVFDGRISIEVNDDMHKSTISTCIYCHNPSDRYINCCNAACNLHFLCCEECDEKYEKACSARCRQYSRYLSC